MSSLICCSIRDGLQINNCSLDLTLNNMYNRRHLGKSRESSTAVTFHALAVYCAGKVGRRPCLI